MLCPGPQPTLWPSLHFLQSGNLPRTRGQTVQNRAVQMWSHQCWDKGTNHCSQFAGYSLQASILLAFNTARAHTNSHSMHCSLGTPGPALTSYHLLSLLQCSRLLCPRGMFLHLSLLKIPANDKFWAPSSSSTALALGYWLFPLIRISSLTWKVPHLSVQMNHSHKNAIPPTNCHLLASVNWKIPSWVLRDKATAHIWDLSCLSWLLFTLYCLLRWTYW